MHSKALEIICTCEMISEKEKVKWSAGRILITRKVDSLNKNAASLAFPTLNCLFLCLHHFSFIKTF